MGVIVGDKIIELSVKKNSDSAERNFKVVINPEITDVTKADAQVMQEKRSGVHFMYNFSVKYGESLGGINVLGAIFFADEEKVLTKLVADWKRDKKILDDNIRMGIMNRMLEVGYVQAINLASQVRLPAPMQFPQFVKEEPKVKPGSKSVAK